jgi:hypothetical protein
MSDSLERYSTQRTTKSGRHRGRNGRKCGPENFIRRKSPLDNEQT